VRRPYGLKFPDHHHPCFFLSNRLHITIHQQSLLSPYLSTPLDHPSPLTWSRVACRSEALRSRHVLLHLPEDSSLPSQQSACSSMCRPLRMKSDASFNNRWHQRGSLALPSQQSASTVHFATKRFRSMTTCSRQFVLPTVVICHIPHLLVVSVPRHHVHRASLTTWNTETGALIQ